MTDDNQTKNFATFWPFAQNHFKSTYSPGKYLIKPFNLKITDGITGRPLRALTLVWFIWHMKICWLNLLFVNTCIEQHPKLRKVFCFANCITNHVLWWVILPRMLDKSNSVNHLDDFSEFCRANLALESYEEMILLVIWQPMKSFVCNLSRHGERI